MFNILRNYFYISYTFYIAPGYAQWLQFSFLHKHIIYYFYFKLYMSKWLPARIYVQHVVAWYPRISEEGFS